MGQLFKYAFLSLIAIALLQVIFTKEEKKETYTPAVRDTTRKTIGYDWQRGVYVYEDDGLAKNSEGYWVPENEIVKPKELKLDPKDRDEPLSAFDLPNY